MQRVRQWLHHLCTLYKSPFSMCFSDESHLLTATHCINQYRPEELRVGGEKLSFLADSFTEESSLSSRWKEKHCKRRQKKAYFFAMISPPSHGVCFSLRSNFAAQIRLGEWDVHTDTEFHPNLEMDILSVRSGSVRLQLWNLVYIFWDILQYPERFSN